jgi:Cu/Zn superoxide dismutase
MNNFTVARDGTAKTTIRNATASLGGGASSLLANGGTALIVHAINAENDAGIRSNLQIVTPN